MRQFVRNDRYLFSAAVLGLSKVRSQGRRRRLNSQRPINSQAASEHGSFRRQAGDGTGAVELSVSPEQVKAARELLGWIQGDLAFEARLSQTSVSQFERGARHCGRQLIDAMQRALEAAGIEFISGDQPAVKIRDTP